MSPVILFIYNRPDHVRQTLEALSRNTLAQETDLFVFADGIKENATDNQRQDILKAREVARQKNWCRSVTVTEAEKNKGLAASIISGVTEIINRYGTAIVLEDDIVTGTHFLEYMNDALERYKDEKSVWHITGWRDPVRCKQKDGAFFYPKMDCWGWATWADRWQNFRKDPEFYLRTFTKKQIYRFNMDNTDKIQFGMIRSNAEGGMNTWAVFWYATIFTHGGLCLAPSTSLTKNIGFDGSGSHCGENKHQTIRGSIDYKITRFPERIETDRKEYNRTKRFYFRKNFHPWYEIKSRVPKGLKSRIKKILRISDKEL